MLERCDLATGQGTRWGQEEWSSGKVSRTS